MRILYHIKDGGRSCVLRLKNKLGHLTELLYEGEFLCIAIADKSRTTVGDVKRCPMQQSSPAGDWSWPSMEREW